MARLKNLDTLIKNEKVRVQMVPGRIVLKPKSKTTVPLANGGFGEIENETIFVEAEGEHRMGMYSREYDPSDPKDAEVLELLEELLEQRPELRTSVDYQIKVVGVYDAVEPWPGYDEQSAEQVEALWANMPDAMRPNLETVMKHELSRVNEDGESITDDEKVKLLNKWYRERESMQKDAAEDVVAL